MIWQATVGINIFEYSDLFEHSEHIKQEKNQHWLTNMFVCTCYVGRMEQQKALVQVLWRDICSE